MTATKKNILELALYAGEIMLKNGAETYRVEDTIIRICKAYNVHAIEAFVTPTGIFVSVNDENDSESVSFIKRIKNRTIDLNKVSKVNDFSRQLTNSKLSMDEGLQILKTIDHLSKYNKYLKIFCAGIASSFFGILLNAPIQDILSTFMISMLVYIIVSLIENLNSNIFIQNAIGGSTASLLAIIAIYFHIGVHVDKIIISSIMILLPGVAITNAIRDSISGDLFSGLARITEAIVIAISIATGVGIIINFWIHMFGGIL